MNWNRLLTAAVAVCCLLAVGTAATTMDSSVSTEPEEAVAFDYSMLPVGAQDGVGELRRQVSTDDPSAASGDGVSDRESDGDGSHRERHSASRPNAAEDGDPERVSESGAERRQDGGDGPRETARSLLERLLSLLRSLLAYLPAVLGVLALGGAASLLRGRLAGLRGGDAGRAGDDGAALGDPAPRNEVSRAWYEMVERAGLADRYDLTPDEHAERAADRGIDPEAATSLTRLFEEVRYGDAPVTDERRRRARERVQEIRAQARRLRTEGGSER